MKRIIVGLLALFVFALASRTANAQSIRWQGCSVSPNYFNDYGDCEAQASYYGLINAAAFADATAACTAPAFVGLYPGSDANATANAQTTFGTFADAAALTIGNPPGAPDSGLRTTADAIAWGGIPVPATEEESAVAEVDCGGNTSSFDTHGGSYTDATASADITSF